MTRKVKEQIEQIQRGKVPKGYQKVGIFLAPEEWNILRAGDIYSERNEPGEEKLPILTVSIHGGVSDGELDEENIGKKVKRIEDKSQYKKAYTGDLVFNMMRAWQGAAGTVRTTGMVSPAYIVAKPNKSVDPIFMDYYMKTPRMIYNMRSQSYGVTDFRLRLYWDSFAPIKCVLPPVAEQRYIAAVLTTQDKVIELKEQLLEEKKQQKKYLMQQLLTGKKRLPGFGGEWKTIRLNQVLTERTDKNQEQQLRICSVAVREGVVDQIEHLGRSFAAKDTSNYGVAYNGDVIYTKSPTGDFPFGIIKQSHLSESVAVSPLYGIYKPVSYGLGYILHTYFSEPINAKNYLLPIVQKGAKNTINITNKVFASNSLYLPMDISEQNAIAEVFMTADREINLLQQSIEAEKQKKKALMQLLLTGIVRVKI